MTHSHASSDSSQETTDRLEQIFAIQEALNDHIFQKRDIRANDGSVLSMETIRKQLQAGNLGPNGEPNRWLRNYLDALDAESKELRDELLWKWWSGDTLDLQNIRVEIIDLLHFLVSLAQCAGMTADDFHRVYMQKNEVNFNRQTQGYSKATKNESDNRAIQ